MSTSATTEETVPEVASRNYTSEGEKEIWKELKRWSQQWKYSSYPVANYQDPYGSQKENFRTRRNYCYARNTPVRKAFRIRFGNSTEIGAFAKLTNSYALVGGDESDVFCRTVESDLNQIPVIRASLAGCRVIGRMCVGNKYGLVVPEAIYDLELQHIKEQLPDSVEVRKVEERLSALGNVVVCNDRVALVHPDLDKETEEIIADALQVEVYKHMIGSNPLVGSYSVLTNLGGLVSTEIGNDSLENLSSLLELPLFNGTVNSGNKVVASGLLVNDAIIYAGIRTTAREFTAIEKAFQCDKYGMSYL